MTTAAPRPDRHRRALVARGALAAVAAVGGVGGLASGARAHGELGPLEPPRPAPGVGITLHDGRRSSLAAVLRGRTTAVQFMFTGCSTTCPVQGATFATLQPLVLGRVSGAQLLSLSIDPLADDAAALAAWRRRFGATDGWLAAAPPVAHAEALLAFAGGRAAAGRPLGERHNAQVFLFDAQGRLAYRCAEFAAPRDVAAALSALAAQG